MSEIKIGTHWVMDYETLKNCFIGVFEHYKTDERKVFVVCKQRNDLAEFASFLNECVTKNQWHISFNGLNFDAQITQYVLDVQKKLASLDGESIAQALYKFAQETIIIRDRGVPPDFPEWELKINQIDLFKMNHWDNRAKMSSLKWIQYSMDWQNVEEMPHPHYEPISNDNQLKMVIEYCINDVRSTKKILEHSKEQIQLRQTLTKEYGIDLYSASEPRISKELFLHFLSKKLKWNKAEIKTLRTPRQSIVLANCILPYVKFNTPEFKKMLEYFQTKVFPPLRMDLSIV